MSLPVYWPKLKPTYRQCPSVTSKTILANWQNLTLQSIPGLLTETVVD